MTTNHNKTIVAIIGGGVSGLTLATLLQKSGVDCVILERRDRTFIEVRQRAGVVEARGVRMFEKWGLADKLLGGPVAHTIDYRVNGTSRIFEAVADDGSPGRFCTQQMLVNNLMRELIDTMGGDVRYNVTGVEIQNKEDKPTLVRYTDAGGTHELSCDYIVGCDSDRGVCRSSIPHGVVTSYSHEFGYAWLAALVEAPVIAHPIMGVSDHGFVAQLPRGPQKSRYYLQCALSDSAEDWPDERLWDEIRLRLNDMNIKNVMVHDKLFVPLRSVVHSPMQYRKLFLVGDAAHLVPPTGAKGMNLALCDADMLAQALINAVLRNDATGLDNYSNACLPNIWKYQEFSVWMTDTMHDAGDAMQHGEFNKMNARARLDTLFNSPLAGRLHSQYLQGMI